MFQDALGSFAVGALASAVAPLGSGFAAKTLLKYQLIPWVKSALVAGAGGATSGATLSLVTEILDYYVTGKSITISTLCGSATKVLTGTVFGFAGGSFLFKFKVVIPGSTTYVNPYVTVTVPAEFVNMPAVGGIIGVKTGLGLLKEVVTEWLTFMEGCN